MKTLLKGVTVTLLWLVAGGVGWSQCVTWLYNPFTRALDCANDGSGGTAGVVSFNGRTGVVAPGASDYTKGDVGLGNVENTALSTWAGSANITTVGTLASGAVPWSLLTGVTTASPTFANISGASVTVTAGGAGAPMVARTHASTVGTDFFMGVQDSSNVTLGGFRGDGQLLVPALGDGCATWTSGVLGTTGVACGSGGGGAPTDAAYWTAQAEAGLSAEVNLGALTSGLVKIAVSGGVATPATAVADTDYLTPATAASTYQPLSALLTSFAGLSCGDGVGYVSDGAGAVECAGPGVYFATQSSATSWTIAAATHGLGTAAFAVHTYATDGTYYTEIGNEGCPITIATGDVTCNFAEAQAGAILLIASGSSAGGGGGLSNAYGSMTDGSVTASATGADTFKLRSASNLLTVAVQSNDATHGDNALLTVNQANFTLSSIGGAVTDSQVPNNITIDLAATATALAANGGNCSAGQSPLGVDASGVVEGCFTVGDVIGPASSVDNTVARYSLTTGKLIQGSGVEIDDSDNVTIPGNLNVGGTISVGNGTVAGESVMTELTANGSEYRSWMAPDSLAATVRFRFPDAAPSAGDVMTFSAPSTNISSITFQGVASANTASAIVARDASGNFSAGTITAALSGNATSATTATTATTANAGDSATAFFSSGEIEEVRIHADIARDSEVTSAISALSSVYQPLDSDLTTLAGISASNLRISTLGITVDGAGSAITTGTKGFIVVPFACTIQSWSVVADQSGSIVLDVWKNTTTPTNTDTITASAKPTLSTAQLAVAQAATGWTTSVAANDVLGFEVESATTVQRATLTIACQR